MTDTLAPTRTLRFTKWIDPLAAGGFDADSDDALVYLAPFLGPTSVLLLHRISRYLVGPAIDTWTLDDLAATFGVTPSKLTSSLAMLERFGMIRAVGTHIEVRTQVPPLPVHRIERMPAYLAASYPLRHTTTRAA
jgi:hypothetical protein